ncbi:MAG: RNA polymerase sigma factor [Verrucomicrobiota bacterium]
MPFRTPDRQEQRELLQAGYRYAFSLTNHQADAEDLVQQAALKLQRAYGGIQAKNLLFTTIRNLFYDQLRRSRIVRFESIDEVPEPASDAESGTQMDLAELLGSLNDTEREVIYLHYVEGHSATEIGELLDRSRNTVLSQIRRTREKLQKLAESDSNQQSSAL